MIVDLFLIYQFLKRLTTPFEDWDAYELGLIDKNGKVLKKPRTSKEKKALGKFDILLKNLKVLLGKIPGGKSRLASFTAALYLIREENSSDERLDYLNENLDELEEEFLSLQEEVAVNNVGGGNIAGASGSEDPPYKKKNKHKDKKKKDILKRYSSNTHPNK